MKVLAISSSPRKGGNSDVLCDEFLKGAAENGHEVQKIRLAEKKIAPCLACYGCTDSHVCVRRDDMAEVLEALKAADVIVLASPVYFYGISAQLKAVIDRLHTPMRNSFPIKKLALILVGAATLPEMFDAIKVQYKLALNFFGLEDAGTVLVRGAREKGDVKNTDGLKNAYNLGSSM